MTDSRMQRVDGPLAPIPGLELIRTDSDAGLCVDGVCRIPAQHAATAPVEKAD